MVSERALPSPQALLDSSADGFAVLDIEGSPLYVNPAGRRLLGNTDPESGDFLDRIHAADRPQVRRAFAAALESDGASFRVEFRLERRRPESNGGIDRLLSSRPRVRLEAHVAPSQGDDGQIWLLLNLREIKEVSRARAGRVTSELPVSFQSGAPVSGPRDGDLSAKSRLLDMLLDNLPLMACRLDGEGNILESRGLALLEAASGDEGALGRNALEDWPEGRHLLERALRGEPVHFEYESGHGEAKRVLEIWFTPDPVDGGTIGFGVDITERKRTEEELSTSEAFGRRIIESSRDSIMVLDPEGKLLSISYSGRKLMEIEDPEAYLNRSWMEFWRGEDRGRAENAMRAAVRSGVGKFQGYCPSVSGKPKWWDVIITPILNPSWEPERLLAVCRDITEHKRFEESLRRSKEQLEAILRAISDAVVVADAGGRVVYANDAAARLLGLDSAHEILDTALDELSEALSARDESGAPAPWPSMAVEAGGGGKVLRLADKRGAGERWLVAGIAAVRDAEGRVSLLIASAYDFTERKLAEEALHRSEEQLRQSQKMEAVGRLAGGVAHDFNNLLTAINGYSELLNKSLRENDPMQATVGEIQRAGERAASLTRQLLTFSRRQVLASRILDLNEVVEEIRQMLVRLIGEDIHLTTFGEPSLAKIKLDPGQMEQVILNLALNARDAMPRGGRLTIETANARLERGGAGTFFCVEPGSYVRLTVTDTGLGMSEEVKAHLFEPFFTTKPAGEGTGLGLSTVYGIVKTAGGNISVTSEEGKGASFSIYLPAAGSAGERTEAKRVDSAPRTAKARLSGSRGETILLVEDEDMVRRLIGQVLLSHGYNVLEAGSGAAALEVVERHPGRIDLLLTDVVMAGMSGRELSERLVPCRPGLKVLYMSGYTDDAILRHGVYQNSAAFLGKPFSPGTLVRKLREILEGGESPSARPAPTPSVSGS